MGLGVMCGGRGEGGAGRPSVTGAGLGMSKLINGISYDKWVKVSIHLLRCLTGRLSFLAMAWKDSVLKPKP